MAHQISQNDWHFYQCEACGPITLPPNGLIRRTQKSDHAAATEGYGTSTISEPFRRAAKAH
jgi:hypothetical protein